MRKSREGDKCSIRIKTLIRPSTYSRQVVALADATTGTVTSTFGPTVAGSNLIPQLGLILRSTSFILTTSSVSNAAANVAARTSQRQAARGAAPRGTLYSLLYQSFLLPSPWLGRRP